MEVVEGGSFSLFWEWVELVLVWEEVSPAVACVVKEGTVWEDGGGAGVMGVEKSLCTIWGVLEEVGHESLGGYTYVLQTGYHSCK